MGGALRAPRPAPPPCRRPAAPRAAAAARAWEGGGRGGGEEPAAGGAEERVGRHLAARIAELRERAAGLGTGHVSAAVEREGGAEPAHPDGLTGRAAAAREDRRGDAERGQ